MSFFSISYFRFIKEPADIIPTGSEMESYAGSHSELVTGMDPIRDNGNVLTEQKSKERNSGDGASNDLHATPIKESITVPDKPPQVPDKPPRVPDKPLPNLRDDQLQTDPTSFKTMESYENENSPKFLPPQPATGRTL